MIELSVILISKNQEWNIARLIESVLNETTSILQKEIVLVDSASTDRTVEVACNYPINVLKLHSDQPLTPAAGRYVGCNSVKGQFILFLDGDMKLYPGWLKKAVDVMNNKPDVAAVSGLLIDLPKSSGPKDKPVLIEKDLNEMFDIPHGGGAAMYRRSVLEEVGTFNPYLYSEEEPELCIRIRHNGYRIVKLQHPIAYHYTEPGEKLSTLVNRWRRKLYLGYGQNLRYHLGRGTFWLYLKERSYGLPVAFGLLSGLFSLFSFFNSGNKLWINLWLIAVISIIAAWTLYKRNFNHVVCRIFERILTLDGTIKGVFMKPIDPNKYKDNPEIIKIVNQ